MTSVSTAFLCVCVLAASDALGNIHNLSQIERVVVNAIYERVCLCLVLPFETMATERFNIFSGFLLRQWLFPTQPTFLLSFQCNNHTTSSSTRLPPPAAANDDDSNNCSSSIAHSDAVLL